MPRLFLFWLLAAGLAGSLAAQVPPQVALIQQYVRQVETNKALKVQRYSTSYGHPLKPGRDSLFWAYPTDFKCSGVFYYTAGKLVKITEIARVSNAFCENTYYLKDGKLTFVAEKQVWCPYVKQGDIWLRNQPVCRDKKDIAFQGSYFFVNDSCIAKHEQGELNQEPEGMPGYKPRALTTFFPWQAARYLAAFPHPPAPKRH